MTTILSDVLAPNLDVVFCGTAAGSHSAAVGAYYAGRGNHFWDVLYRTGLTPRKLTPHEFHGLLEYRIGLTDFAKQASGADALIGRQHLDVGDTVGRLRPLRPYVVAFNGKKAASLWIGRPSARIEVGMANDPHAIASRLFVLPSTSGMARRYWDERPWCALSAFLRRREAAATVKA